MMTKQAASYRKTKILSGLTNLTGLTKPESRPAQIGLSTKAATFSHIATDRTGKLQ
jgi:hypothetical protein